MGEYCVSSYDIRRVAETSENRTSQLFSISYQISNPIMPMVWLREYWPTFTIQAAGQQSVTNIFNRQSDTGRYKIKYFCLVYHWCTVGNWSNGLSKSRQYRNGRPGVATKPSTNSLYIFYCKRYNSTVKKSSRRRISKTSSTKLLKHFINTF